MENHDNDLLRHLVGKRHLPLKALVCIFGLYLAIRYSDALISLVGTLLSALMPVIMGFAIAYVVNIFLDFFERTVLSRGGSLTRRLRRPLSILLSYASFVLIIGTVAFMIVPHLVNAVERIYDALPLLLEELAGDAGIMEALAFLPEGVIGSIRDADAKALMAQVLSFLSRGLSSQGGDIASVVSTASSSMLNVALALIFSIYLLADKESLGSQVSRVLSAYLSPGVRVRARHVGHVLNTSFHNYIVGQFTEAVVIGVLCAIGMTIFRFPYAAPVGALVGVTALVPIVGAYVGAAAGFLLVAAVSPMKGALFLAFIVALQQIENNLIYPRVVGTSIGLPGIWVLAAVTVWGSLSGVAGMLVGVPLTSSAYQLLKEDVRRKETDAQTRSDEGRAAA